MPDFSRPPEWQQPADRHTALVDPVLTVRQLTRFEFNRKHHTRIDHALVFATAKGAYDAYLPPHRPTRGDVASKRYSAVYEVDMGIHPARTDLALPSDNDAFEFGAEVEMTWQVTDPRLFVESGHRDVPALLVAELQRSARPVTRRFPIDRSSEAEAELLKALHSMNQLGSGVGLQVSWTLRLRRDQGAIEHQHKLRNIGHQVAEQIHGTELGMSYDAVLNERQLQQNAFQLEQRVAYERQHQDFALEQQRRQHELAMEHSRQQLELQRVEADKIAFYAWHLQQGGVHGFALHLARNPQDTGLIMSNMREDQLRLIHSQMDLVKQLLSDDSAEHYELAGPKKLALQTVSDILNQRLPGVTQTPPPAAGSEYGTIQGTPPAVSGGIGGADQAADGDADGDADGGATPSAPPPPPHTADPYASAPHTSAPHASAPHASAPYTPTPYGPGSPGAAPVSGFPAMPPFPPQAGSPLPPAPDAAPTGWQPPAGYGTVPAPSVPVPPETATETATETETAAPAGPGDATTDPAQPTDAGANSQQGNGSSMDTPSTDTQRGPG